MKHKQSGFTMMELLAYLAVAGTLSYGVMTGAQMVMREVALKRDISEIKLMEKDIRLYSAVLNDYTPVAVGGGTAPTLQEFICNRGLSSCRNGVIKTNSGKVVTLENASPSRTVDAEIIPTSFVLKIEPLPKYECVKMAEENWGKNATVACVYENEDTETCFKASMYGKISINAKAVCPIATSALKIFYK